jgi:diacylglycerol kinase family enzyme
MSVNGPKTSIKLPAKDQDILVFYNPHSGKKRIKRGSLLQQLTAEFERVGLKPNFHSIEELAQVAADKSANHKVVIVAGGDGTVRAVVNEFFDQDVTVGIVPLGTFNHLAKDLGIPISCPEAIQVIVDGVISKIDFATVNGCVFINNSSIGMYTKAVKFRKVYSGFFNWFAMTLAAFNILKRLPFLTVNYHFENKNIEVVTPLVFISNNQYEMNLLKLTQRERLDEGKLYLYLNESHSHLDFIKILFNVLLRRQTKIKNKFRIEAIEQCTLKLKKKSISVAIDGEVQQFDTPLQYKIHPKKLSIITPNEIP